MSIHLCPWPVTELWLETNTADHSIPAGAASPKWFAASPGKRWTEVFFLAYSPFWIVWALGILVPFRLYDVCAVPAHVCSCS